jgi:hypothetical protein
MVRQDRLGFMQRADQVSYQPHAQAAQEGPLIGVVGLVNQAK